MEHFEEKLSTHCELNLNYIVSGSGSTVYLCFHGFGRSSRDYVNYPELLGENIKLIAVDMFLHGKSTYPEDRIRKNPISPKEMVQVINAILKKEGVSKFHLIGYSMGGRISQLLVEHQPERVLSLNLMAPDAISESPWYNFASRTMVGQWIYRSTLKNPGWLFGLMDALSFVRLLPRTLTKFVKFQMETEEKRRKVYNVWMALRKIKPKLKTVKKNIRSNNIPYIVIFGKYDRIIPPELGDRFSKGIEDLGQMKVIENGHNFIKPEIEELICAMILDSHK